MNNINGRPDMPDPDHGFLSAYRCQVCGQRFNSIGKLRRHINAGDHRNGNGGNGTGGNGFVPGGRMVDDGGAFGRDFAFGDIACNICGKRFATRTELVRHRNNVHGYVCPYDQRRFETQELLNDHLFKIHHKRDGGAFGKKRKRKKKSTKTKKDAGWCIKKNSVVKVYKLKTANGKKWKKGKYYRDRKKVSSKVRCYKTKTKANAALNRKKRKRRRKSSKTYYYVPYSTPSSRRGIRGCSSRYNPGSCGSNPNCSWTGARCVRKGGGTYQGPTNIHAFGSAFGSNQINPTNKTNYQIYQWGNNSGTPSNDITGISAYSYPTSGPNYRFYTQRDNYSGYGF